MKSIFRGNIFKFTGTPLQLHLMLEGSIKHFKDLWENNEYKNLVLKMRWGLVKVMHWMCMKILLI